MSAEEAAAAAAALATMKEDAGRSGAEAADHQSVQVHGNMQVSAPRLEGSGRLFRGEFCAVDDTPAAVSMLAPPRFLRFCGFCATGCRRGCCASFCCAVREHGNF